MNMATSDVAVLEVESVSSKDSDSELQFQDFSLSGKRAHHTDTTHHFTRFPDAPESDDEDDTEDAELLREGEKASTQHSPWSFAYYQSFFDVNTDQVLQRILWSSVPNFSANYLQKYIRPNPDLYGPFWICATLIFSIAISGNLTNYLQMANLGNYVWSYDFNKVTLAATAVYTYVTLIPLALWILLWYRKSQAEYTFLEILCLYGYSLAIYVPISVLWVVQVPLFRWLLVILGSAISGSVLVISLWPAVKNDVKKVALGAMALVILFHFLLATGFVSYFFYIPESAVEASTISTTTVKISTTTAAATTTNSTH